MALTKVPTTMFKGQPFNYAQNAEFRFFQRQTPGTLTAYADDNYGPDRWYVLNSGGNTSVARVAEVITSSPSPYACQIRQADGSSQRFGVAQILEYDRSVRLRGKTVSFNFFARTDGTEVSNIRAALIEWTGTADSVTSDIVSSWAATPTLIANATAVNTPADLALTGTMQQFNVTATLGTTFNNLILFVWSSAAEAQNDDFYVTQIQLIEGTGPAPWSVVSKALEDDLRECRRFYEKSYEIDTAPGTATVNGQVSEVAMAATTGATANNGSCGLRYRETKRSAGSFQVYDPSTGTAGNITYARAGLAGASSAATVAVTSAEGVAGVYVSPGSGFTVGQAVEQLFQWRCDAEL